MNRRGSASVGVLFLTLGAALFARLAADLSAAASTGERARTAADFALLSALRVRGQSLEAVAGRWRAFGASIVVDGADLAVPPGSLPAVAAAAEALRRALPGYQGRVSSALTVSVEANGFGRDAVSIVDDAGTRIGLEAQTGTLREPAGPVVSVDGLWYRRRWTDARRAGASEITVDFSSPHAFGTWRGRTRSSASLSWDADLNDPAVAAAGNGGFASSAGETTITGRFDPHRFPAYRAALGEAAP